MAFTPESPRIPTFIGDISITLTDYADMAISDRADYEAQVLDADGSLFCLTSGNLVPHLTVGQISALQAFMADMRAKAESEILP